MLKEVMDMVCERQNHPSPLGTIVALIGCDLRDGSQISIEDKKFDFHGHFLLLLSSF
jgi:hypothetical protein